LPEIPLIVGQRVGAVLPINGIMFRHKGMRIHDVIAFALSFAKSCRTIVTPDVSLLAGHI